MTISSDTSQVTYNTDGVEDEFDTGFRVLQEEDLEVVFVNSDGDDTTYVLNTDYTVTLDPDNDDATVTCTSPPADGGQISLRRVTEQVQDVDLVAQGPLPSEAIERALDKLTMQVQELQAQVNRVVLEPVIPSEPTLQGLYVYAGTAAPADPEEGQIFFDINTHYWYVWAMTASVGAWVRFGQSLGAPTGTYQLNMGFLPKWAGSDHPLTGHLYCNGNSVTHRVIGVATPVEDNDAVPRAWLATYYVPKVGGVTLSGSLSMGSAYQITNLGTQNDSTDGGTASRLDYVRTQTHDGSDGAAIPVANVDPGTVSNGAVPYVTSNALSMVSPIAVDFTASIASTIDTGYHDICEVTVTLPATTTQLWVHFTMQANGAQSYDIKLLNAADATIVEDTAWFTSTTESMGVYNYLFTPGSTGSYTVTAQVKAGSDTDIESNAFLYVAMC